MSKLERGRAFRYAVVAALLASCSSGDGRTPEEEGERVADGAFGTTAAMSPDALVDAANTALTRCGGGCTSDLDAGREALARGDMLQAREIYACADTFEAAFGAGLATLLSVIESERGDRVLADLGLPHFPASDLLGSDGYLSRYAERATGSGELEVTEGVTASVALERIVLEAGDGYVEASTHDTSGREIDVELDGYLGLSVGSSPVQYDCTSQFNGSRIDSGPRLYITITDRQAGHIFDCHIPFALSACAQSGGSFEIIENGSSEGDAVDITIDNVLMDCFLNDLDWEPISPIPSPARVQGRISGTVAAPVETSDLHPLLRDEYSTDSIPAETRLRTFLAHAASITEDLAQAACFFDTAAQEGSFEFELPDALAGSRGLTLKAADAKTFANAAALGAAALQLAGIYDADIALRDLVCLTDTDEGTCGGSEVVIAEINAALTGASVRRDRLAAARLFLEEGLARFELLAGELNETTLLPRNAQTAPGIDALRAIARRALASSSGAQSFLPYVQPQTEIDLERFFTKLPEPNKVPGELIVFEEECDQFECWTDQYLDATYATLLWPLGIDFEQEVEFEDPQDEHIESALEGAVDSLRGAFALEN